MHNMTKKRGPFLSNIPDCVMTICDTLPVDTWNLKAKSLFKTPRRNRIRVMRYFCSEDNFRDGPAFTVGETNYILGKLEAFQVLKNSGKQFFSLPSHVTIDAFNFTKPNTILNIDVVLKPVKNLTSHSRVS